VGAVKATASPRARIAATTLFIELLLLRDPLMTHTQAGTLKTYLVSWWAALRCSDAVTE
jgi:hypothetical protein